VVGTNVAHYRIEREIGAGGMGVVYLARDTRLERPVALKFVRPGDDPGRPRSSLLREARAACALNHPNVCTVHEVGDADGATYIVMEYVEGQTLSDRIAAGPLAPDAVIAIGGQIAAALAHAHERGIVHRDLKSANVRLGPEDRIKVLDFGLSRRIGGTEGDVTRPSESLADAGGMAGTLPYLSPEVLRGGTADAQADLWALAVTLYEMCAGRRPFGGATPYETSAAILQANPPPLPSGVPAPLRRVVERGLARDAASRFPDAAALRRALEEAARGRGAAPGPAAGSTLVVLPFDNLSGDPSQDFFADGMTEAVTAAVARLGSVRVISRTSAMQFRGGRRALPEIAQRLGADLAVEGSVVRAGDRVRITAQLIDARTDEHLWADSLDRDLTDVLDLQDDVARAIVQGLRGRVASTEPPGDAPPASTPAPRRVDPAAYDEYLRGRHAWALRTPDALRQGIAHYRRAIEHDPAYARAHAGVAECFGVLGFMGHSAPRNSFAPAKAAAQRALALDPSVGSAHVALGYVATHYRWELEAAARSLEEGLRLEPEEPNGRHWYALLLASRGERDAALEQMRRAAELDPLSMIARTAMGLLLLFFGDLDGAAAECRDALELDPGSPAARWTLGKVLLARGDVGRAREVLEALAAEPGRFLAVLGDYGKALGLAGEASRARDVLAELRSAAERAYVRPVDVARVHLGLGERDAALEELEKALHEGGNWLNYLHLDPGFAELRGSARFASLLERRFSPDIR